MRKARRRPVWYCASSMPDGAVIGAHPVRKPRKEHLRLMGQRIDADGAADMVGSYVGAIGDMNDIQKARFSIALATRLNTRRAVRELILPELAAINEKLDRLERRLSELGAVGGK